MILKIPEPSERQKEFFRLKNRYINFGGSRGGGKSWALRVKALLLALRYPGITIIILRRSLQELRENHMIPLGEMTKGLASWRDKDKTLSFLNSSRILFGYCSAESDVLQYQGQQYDIIMLDEATQFTETQWMRIYPSCRGANDFPHRIYLSCNPGGVGHAWVKRLFIDRDFKENENPEDYAFVKSTVYDNEALLKKDPGYVKMLESLPEKLRRAWLNGDWDAYEGQYFPEFDRDIHVVQPFEIPDDYTRYVTLDYGLDMCACYWVAVTPEGMAFVYRELYESGLIASEAAEKINDLSNGEDINEYIAPPDLWNRRNDTGRSVAEIFGENDIYLSKCDNDRINGWMDLHEWLKPIEIRTDDGTQKVPHIRFFSSCKNVIRCLPLLQFNEHRVNDVASEPHELTHGPDAIRYFCAGRPCAEYKPPKKVEKWPEPLREDEEERGYCW